MTVSLLTRGYITRRKSIIEQVPLTPTEVENLLAKALELPLPPEFTEAKGIHQSDIIIRTALIAAIADLRAKPFLLDYVFASLAQDSQTLKDYGEKEIQAAKDWFLKTNIPVFMVPRIDEAKLPCISIKLVSSDESEVTLGDIHYQPTEDNGFEWPALAGPFSVAGYDPATGIVILPSSAVSNIVVVPGMFLVDDNGTPHQITEVVLTNATYADANTFPLVLPAVFGPLLTDEGGLFPLNAFRIEAGLSVPFSKAELKGINPAFVTSIESVWYREQYQIGVHVSSEPVYLTWLHSIVVFILLRYKEALLEARGFERSVFASSDFERSEFNEGENAFSRYITVTGNVRQYWPKDIEPKVQYVEQVLQPIGSGNLPPDVDPDTQLWIGDEDTLDPPKK